MSAQAIEFEIAQHFKSSVQLAISLLSGEVENVSPWRWAVIAIHDAIYCALVAKLSRSDMSGVYPDRLEKKFVDFYNRGLDSRSLEWQKLSREQAQSNLADLATLVKRAELASGASIHKSVSSANGRARSLTLLKKRRDVFVHAGDYSFFATDDELRDICFGAVETLREILDLEGYRHEKFGKDGGRELVGRLRNALGKKD